MVQMTLMHRPSEKRKVARRACLACRDKKIRCDGEARAERGGGPGVCSNCALQRLECVFVRSQRGGRRPPKKQLPHKKFLVQTFAANRLAETSLDHGGGPLRLAPPLVQSRGRHSMDDEKRVSRYCSQAASLEVAAPSTPMREFCATVSTRGRCQRYLLPPHVPPAGPLSSPIASQPSQYMQPPVSGSTKFPKLPIEQAMAPRTVLYSSTCAPNLPPSRRASLGVVNSPSSFSVPFPSYTVRPLPITTPASQLRSIQDLTAGNAQCQSSRNSDLRVSPVTSSGASNTGKTSTVRSGDAMQCPVGRYRADFGTLPSEVVEYYIEAYYIYVEPHLRLLSDSEERPENVGTLNPAVQSAIFLCASPYVKHNVTYDSAYFLDMLWKSWHRLDSEYATVQHVLLLCYFYLNHLPVSGSCKFTIEKLIRILILGKVPDSLARKHTDMQLAQFLPRAMAENCAHMLQLLCRVFYLLQKIILFSQDSEWLVSLFKSLNADNLLATFMPVGVPTNYKYTSKLFSTNSQQSTTEHMLHVLFSSWKEGRVPNNEFIGTLQEMQPRINTNVYKLSDGNTIYLQSISNLKVKVISDAMLLQYLNCSSREKFKFQLDLRVPDLEISMQGVNEFLTRILSNMNAGTISQLLLRLFTLVDILYSLDLAANGVQSTRVPDMKSKYNVPETSKFNRTDNAVSYSPSSSPLSTEDGYRTEVWCDEEYISKKSLLQLEESNSSTEILYGDGPAGEAMGVSCRHYPEFFDNLLVDMLPTLVMIILIFNTYVKPQYAGGKWAFTYPAKRIIPLGETAFGGEFKYICSGTLLFHAIPMEEITHDVVFQMLQTLINRRSILCQLRSYADIVVVKSQRLNYNGAIGRNLTKLLALLEAVV
ncbi:AaceriACR209Wp [[Ashbya] aceris (nom. inval.)]|nr:AaceriACR209Wp [[Ashbya] aceris (nom. inval.)]